MDVTAISSWLEYIKKEVLQVIRIAFALYRSQNLVYEGQAVKEVPRTYLVI